MQKRKYKRVNLEGTLCSCTTQHITQPYKEGIYMVLGIKSIVLRGKWIAIQCSGCRIRGHAALCILLEEELDIFLV